MLIHTGVIVLGSKTGVVLRNSILRRTRSTGMVVKAATVEDRLEVLLAAAKASMVSTSIRLMECLPRHPTISTTVLRHQPMRVLLVNNFLGRVGTVPPIRAVSVDSELGQALHSRTTACLRFSDDRSLITKGAKV